MHQTSRLCVLCVLGVLSTGWASLHGDFYPVGWLLPQFAALHTRMYTCSQVRSVNARARQYHSSVMLYWSQRRSKEDME